MHEIAPTQDLVLLQASYRMLAGGRFVQRRSAQNRAQSKTDVFLTKLVATLKVRVNPNPRAVPNSQDGEVVDGALDFGVSRPGGRDTGVYIFGSFTYFVR